MCRGQEGEGGRGRRGGREGEGGTDMFLLGLSGAGKKRPRGGGVPQAGEQELEK